MIPMPPWLLEAAYVHAVTPFVASFLAVSLAVALVTSLIRLGEPGRIAAETWRFFSTIVICIVVFALVVVALEWIFVRS
jgi:hypothetical protein